MSQDYHHQGIFSFSNGFERSQQEHQQQQHQQHIAQQIQSSGLPGYETAGMLSEIGIVTDKEEEWWWVVWDRWENPKIKTLWASVTL
ncbi:unnamed protein product [Coffea canephora]|uniref:Uncharacterized protein n=1 Tax=Coffea canephora TaxID=49390 RepID=A0A068U266_COFCA|nr:unnamed protein product [Coffea canephora]